MLEGWEWIFIFGFAAMVMPNPNFFVLFWCIFCFYLYLDLQFLCRSILFAAK